MVTSPCFVTALLANDSGTLASNSLLTVLVRIVIWGMLGEGQDWAFERPQRGHEGSGKMMWEVGSKM